MKCIFLLLLLYMGLTLANFLDLFSGDKWKVLVNAPAPSFIIILTSIVAEWFLHKLFRNRDIEYSNREIEDLKREINAREKSHNEIEKLYKLRIENLEQDNKRLKDNLLTPNVNTNTSNRKAYLKEELLKTSTEIKQFIMEFDIQIEAISSQHRTKEIKADTLERDRLWHEYRQDEISFGSRRVAEYVARFAKKTEVLRQKVLKELATDNPFDNMIYAGFYLDPKSPNNIKAIANELEKFAMELDKEK